MLEDMLRMGKSKVYGDEDIVEVIEDFEYKDRREGFSSCNREIGTCLG